MVVVNLVLIFIATHLFIYLFLFLLFFLLFFLFLKILEVSVILALLFSLLRNPSLMAIEIEIFDEIGTIIVILVYWAWVSLRVIFIFLEEHRNLWRSMLKITPGLNWLTVNVVGYFIFVDILRSNLILQDVLICAESLIVIIYLKILQKL